jgi:hypothetical protein
MIAGRNGFVLGLAALAASLIGAPASAQTPAHSPAVEAAQIEGFEDCLRIRSGEAFETIAKARGYAPDEQGRWIRRLDGRVLWFTADKPGPGEEGRCAALASPANAPHDRLLATVSAQAGKLGLIDKGSDTSGEGSVLRNFETPDGQPYIGFSVGVSESSEGLPGGMSGVMVLWE